MEQGNNVRAELGRIVAGSYYDYQQIRTQTMNRIRDIVYRRMENLDLTEVQERKPEEKKYLEKYKDEFIPQYIRILNEEGKLEEEEKEFVEKTLEVQKRAKQQERDYQKLMKDFVENESIYTEFLEKIKGISQVISTNLIKEFGYCEKARYISSLWKYCGMHTDKQGNAPVRKAGQKLEFSLRLRSMVWNIADSFVKQRTPFYREIYDQEKERQTNLLENAISKMSKEEKKEFDKITRRKEKREFMNKFDKKAPVSPMNAELRSKRKMVKIFLAHYWQCAKDLTNQEKPEPYVQEKIGHQHISNWKEAVEAQLKKKADDTVKK